MAQSQHGYQINEFIERNLSAITDMKKPTAYATLDKLSREGYIEVRMEQEGNRPPRKVYSINDKGREYFYQLLMDNLSSVESVNYQGDIGLMFIDHLPLKDAAASLEIRLEKSRKLVEVMAMTPDHGATPGVNLAIRHKMVMQQAEMAFIEQTVRDMKKKLAEIPEKS